MATLDDELRQQAVRRIRRRKALWLLVVTYLVVNVLLVVVWLFTGRGYFWPVWVFAGWGVGMAFTAISVFAIGETMGTPREEEIRREVERQRNRAA